MKISSSLALITFSILILSTAAFAQQAESISIKTKTADQAVLDSARVIRRLTGQSLIKLRNKFKRRSTSGLTLPLTATKTVNVNCPNEGGSAQVAGVITTDGKRPPKSMSVDTDITLDNCKGFDGTLSLSGDVSFAAGSGTLSEELSGTLEGICTDSLPLSLTLDVSVSGYVNVQSLSANGLVTGTLIGTCGPISINCAWTDVSLTNAAALDAACTLQ